MDIITYIDSIGRTCFGELEERGDWGFKVKSPAMIMVTPNDPNNMKVDVMPLFFTEFASGEAPVFTYTLGQYTEVQVKISEKILEHYTAKINVTQDPDAQTPAEPLEEDVPEVTLFEDEE